MTSLTAIVTGKVVEIITDEIFSIRWLNLLEVTSRKVRITKKLLCRQQEGIFMVFEKASG